MLLSTHALDKEKYDLWLLLKTRTSPLFSF